MAGTASQVQSITTDETRNVAVDMSGLLDDGELLTGTPTVTGDATMTISGEQINGSAKTINGVSVATSQAALFTLQCSTAGKFYIEVKCNTDASQVVEVDIIVNVEATRYA